MVGSVTGNSLAHVSAAIDVDGLAGIKPFLASVAAASATSSRFPKRPIRRRSGVIDQD